MVAAFAAQVGRDIKEPIVSPQPARIILLQFRETLVPHGRCRGLGSEYESAAGLLLGIGCTSSPDLA